MLLTLQSSEWDILVFLGTCFVLPLGLLIFLLIFLLILYCREKPFRDLSSRDPETHRRAVAMLARDGSPRALQVLIAHLGDPMVNEALTAFSPDDVWDGLAAQLKKLQSPDALVRTACVMGDINPTRATEAFNALADALVRLSPEEQLEVATVLKQVSPARLNKRLRAMIHAYDIENALIKARYEELCRFGTAALAILLPIATNIETALNKDSYKYEEWERYHTVLIRANAS